MKHLLLLFLALPFSSFAQPLSIVPLRDSVWVVTTWHAFDGTPFPSNSLVVATKKGIIMIDTPWDTTQVEPLLDSIDDHFHQRVELCVATHFHDDRTGGFAVLQRQGIPTYSSALTRDYCEKEGNTPAAFTFVNDTIFQVGECTFETFFPGAGHAPDNIVIWFPEWQLLYGGCFIKSPESPTLGNLGDADPVSWEHGVKRVQQRYKYPKYIITGHQDWQSRRSLKYTAKLLKQARTQESKAKSGKKR